MKDNWYGKITVENIEEVSLKILDMLDKKKYTFVEVYEYKKYRPETRLHQELENGSNGTSLSVWYSEDGTYAGSIFCDTYGVWDLSTTGDEFVSFSWGSILIEGKSPSGLYFYWQITVEHE